MSHIELTQQHIELFNKDGFVVVENVLDEAEVNAARGRFEPLFSGEFETGIEPDEWNWRADNSDKSLTRQICNGWRADKTIASIVLRPDIGKACATLRQWTGARINQDNVIWKPPNSKPLGFHQDESYQLWNTPGEMMTCWITLDDTTSHGGTIEYVKGSHLWPLSGAVKQFHAPDNPLADMKVAAENAGVKPEIIPIEISAGSAVFHHGKTWHGSRSNEGANHRRSVISHCMSAQSKYHPENDHPVYGKFRESGSLDMPTENFPVLWQES